MGAFRALLVLLGVPKPKEDGGAEPLCQVCYERLNFLPGTGL